MKRIALHLIGMLVLGLLAMWAFVAIVETRIGTPLNSRQEAASASPVSALAAGLNEDVRLAVDSLPSDRAAAARAIDAGKRASKLGVEAAGEPFASLHEKFKQAHRAIANGKPEQAREVLADATKPVAQVQHESGSPSNLQPYVGATVIDGQGIRIGEVTAVTEHDGQKKVQIALGGVRDALGFIDVGGRRVWTSPDSLVFGKVKTLGATHVAWPTAPQQLAQASP